MDEDDRQIRPALNISQCGKNSVTVVSKRSLCVETQWLPAPFNMIKLVTGNCTYKYHLL